MRVIEPEEYQVQKMPAFLRSPLVTFLGAPFHVLQRMNVLAMGRKTNIKPKVKSETVKAFKLSSQHSRGSQAPAM
jgi:hypothetical protein